MSIFNGQPISPTEATLVAEQIDHQDLSSNLNDLLIEDPHFENPYIWNIDEILIVLGTIQISDVDKNRIYMNFSTRILELATTSPQSVEFLNILNIESESISIARDENKKNILTNIKYWKSYIKTPKPPFKLHIFELVHIIKCYFGWFIDWQSCVRYDHSLPLSKRQVVEA